jgi:hypothetical protein
MDGHGSTVTFGTSGFSAKIISIDGPEPSRESLDETYMDTEDAKEFDPANLYDGGTLTIKVRHGVTVEPPIITTDAPENETITITWGLTGDTWAFSGHCTKYKPSASIGQRMEADMDVKVSGVITIS